MKTLGTLFSGGELFGIGAEMAGYKSLWGIEYDDKIAAIARLNGFPVITGDVRNMALQQDLPKVDHLHASPPCPNFSVAKTGGEETETDVQLADAVCWFLEYKRPETFTLENVPAYRHSQSFKRIAAKLEELGYWWDVNNLNSADFGVPQTRLRLWIRAKKGMMLYPYPEPMKWQCWYQAIEDLIPALPDTKFAPWQIARLPKEYKEFMIGQGTYSPALEPHEPAQTITSNNNQSAIKAFIFSGGNNSFADAYEGNGVRYEDEPASTMMAGITESKIKAFVVDGMSNNYGESVTVRNGDTPIFTQTSSAEKRPVRAFTDGRIVKMTVKALGRFQTVPDWYQGLTVRINGNGVPCELAKSIMTSL